MKLGRIVWVVGAAMALAVTGCGKKEETETPDGADTNGANGDLTTVDVSRFYGAFNGTTTTRWGNHEERETGTFTIGADPARQRELTYFYLPAEGHGSYSFNDPEGTPRVRSLWIEGRKIVMDETVIYRDGSRTTARGTLDFTAAYDAFDAAAAINDHIHGAMTMSGHFTRNP